MKRYFLLFFASCLLLGASVFPAWADKRAKIVFEKSSHDFGDIRESEGDVTCTFTFTNTGDAPLLILRAQASCGCTSPDYPKHPLRPGECGTISVTYHAKGRPGVFQKSVYIYDNSTANHRTTLLINGNVLSDRRPEETYTQKLGAGLRMKIKSLSFFDVFPNTTRTRSLALYNESDSPIRLDFSGVPKHIYVESDPQIIEPKKEGKLLITYYPGKVKDWGFRKDDFEIVVRGREAMMSNNRIIVTADIQEDFSALSKKERAAAPIVEVDHSTLDFGKNAQSKTISVNVSNRGKNKLLIRKVQNSEPEMFSCALDETAVKSGEYTRLNITFHPEKCRLMSINHHVTLITNDPENPYLIINMTASK